MAPPMMHSSSSTLSINSQLQLAEVQQGPCSRSLLEATAKQSSLTGKTCNMHAPSVK
jgi:hypothetical protein